MKTSLLSAWALGAALTVLPTFIAMGDDGTAPIQPSNSMGNAAPTDVQRERLERLKAALEQLDLTDAQKAQIKQIRTSVPAGQERRQQIVAVLTPDQRAKLRRLMQEHRSEAGASSAAAGQ